jgi:hypothetical protein
MVLSAGASAHHSPNLHFDRNDVAEVAGELIEIGWQNPHTQLKVAARDAEGREVIWRVEGRGASQFARAGLTRDIFTAGDQVRVAGFRGRRNPAALFATNILLADGRELVAENFAEPRWTQTLAVMTTAPLRRSAADDAAADAEGLFRVWSRDSSDHGIDGTGRTLWLDRYPLTARARAAQASWDRIADNPYIRCQTGMPAVMDQGYPLEFLRDGDDIVLRLEELDTVRRIHMGDAEAAFAEGPDPLGYSRGHWEDETLVVVTTEIDWPWFDQSGIPQTEALELAERFTPSADGRVLSYTVTATDPAIFTEPVVLDRRWVWVPGETLRPYECSWNRDDL